VKFRPSVIFSSSSAEAAVNGHVSKLSVFCFLFSHNWSCLVGAESVSEIEQLITSGLRELLRV